MSNVGDGVVQVVTGALAGGTVWGDRTTGYTADSDKSKAVVHAGLLAPGETAKIRFSTFAGRDAFPGSTRNGVKSNPYGSWPTSMHMEVIEFMTEKSGFFEQKKMEDKKEEAKREAVRGAVARALADPAPVQWKTDSVHTPGRSLVMSIRGADPGAFGTVWGDVTPGYTYDSNKERAVVHAGLSKPGETKSYRVSYTAGLPGYPGSTKNGISSQQYGPWSSTMHFKLLTGDEVEDEKQKQVEERTKMKKEMEEEAQAKRKQKQSGAASPEERASPATAKSLTTAPTPLRVSERRKFQALSTACAKLSFVTGIPENDLLGENSSILNLEKTYHGDWRLALLSLVEVIESPILRSTQLLEPHHVDLLQGNLSSKSVSPLAQDAQLEVQELKCVIAACQRRYHLTEEKSLLYLRLSDWDLDKIAEHIKLKKSVPLIDHPQLSTVVMSFLGTSELLTGLRASGNTAVSSAVDEHITGLCVDHVVTLMQEEEGGDDEENTATGGGGGAPQGKDRQFSKTAAPTSANMKQHQTASGVSVLPLVQGALLLMLLQKIPSCHQAFLEEVFRRLELSEGDDGKNLLEPQRAVFSGNGHEKLKLASVSWDDVTAPDVKGVYLQFPFSCARLMRENVGPLQSVAPSKRTIKGNHFSNRGEGDKTSTTAMMGGSMAVEAPDGSVRARSSFFYDVSNGGPLSTMKPLQFLHVVLVPMCSDIYQPELRFQAPRVNVYIHPRGPQPQVGEEVPKLPLCVTPYVEVILSNGYKNGKLPPVLVSEHPNKVFSPAVVKISQLPSSKNPIDVFLGVDCVKEKNHHVDAHQTTAIPLPQGITYTIPGANAVDAKPKMVVGLQGVTRCVDLSSLRTMGNDTTQKGQEQSEALLRGILQLQQWVSIQQEQDQGVENMPPRPCSYDASAGEKEKQALAAVFDDSSDNEDYQVADTGYDDYDYDY